GFPCLAIPVACRAPFRYDCPVPLTLPAAFPDARRAAATPWRTHLPPARQQATHRTATTTSRRPPPFFARSAVPRERSGYFRYSGPAGTSLAGANHAFPDSRAFARAAARTRGAE